MCGYVRALGKTQLCLAHSVARDVSPERANAFIDHPKSWELRPIKFVAYDEGLYEALQRAAR